MWYKFGKYCGGCKTASAEQGIFTLYLFTTALTMFSRDYEENYFRNVKREPLRSINGPLGQVREIFYEFMKVCIGVELKVILL